MFVKRGSDKRVHHQRERKREEGKRREDEKEEGKSGESKRERRRIPRWRSRGREVWSTTRREDTVLVHT